MGTLETSCVWERSSDKIVVGKRMSIVLELLGRSAKLEKPMAVNQLEAIVARADGIMVARGDLGVEMPPEQVPTVQRRILRAW